MDAVGELTEIIERLDQPTADVGELLVEITGLWRRELLGDRQVERQRDESLLHSVVQVTLDAPPGLVAGCDHPRPGRGELGPGLGVGDRRRRQLGELPDAELGPDRDGSRDGDGGSDHHAPQAVVDDDRASGARSDTQLPQPLGQGTRTALEVVDPSRPARAQHHGGDVLALEPQP